MSDEEYQRAIDQLEEKMVQNLAVKNNNKVGKGRPRLLVNFGLLLDYRRGQNMGWGRVAMAYSEKTGQFISKQTCRRRYEEFMATESKHSTKKV